MVLKIGGSVLTNKQEECVSNPESIERIAGEIARAGASSLVLVHGAGSFGHPQVKRHRLEYAPTTVGVIETHGAVVELNRLFVEALQDAGVSAVGVHPLDCARVDEEGVLWIDSEVISGMVDFGLVPVLHGDVVVDARRGVSVVSGDRLLGVLARFLDVRLIGAGSDVDGVLDEQGEVIPCINRDNFHEIEVHLGPSSGVDVTRGMRGKVEELLKIAEYGIESLIFNAGVKDMVFNFLLSGGDVVGTRIGARCGL